MNFILKLALIGLVASTLSLTSCGQDKVDDLNAKVQAVIAGVKSQCNWLPTAAGIVAVFRADAGIAVATVVAKICEQVEQHAAFNPGMFVFAQDDSKPSEVCIDVDGKTVCIDKDEG